MYAWNIWHTADKFSSAVHAGIERISRVRCTIPNLRVGAIGISDWKKFTAVNNFGKFINSSDHGMWNRTTDFVVVICLDEWKIWIELTAMFTWGIPLSKFKYSFSVPYLICILSYLGVKQDSSQTCCCQQDKASCTCCWSLQSRTKAFWRKLCKHLQSCSVLFCKIFVLR